MQQIKVAKLLLGSEPFYDSNKSKVYRGYIQTELDDEPVLAFFKIIPARDVLVEAVCSLIATQLELPTPEPYLIIMDKDSCPDSKADLEIPAFGTVDARKPSFRRYSSSHSLNNDEIEKILLKWKEFSETATFDEFIGNIDRNVGNLLYDGKTITLIDHELSILANHRADKPNSINKLFSVVKKRDEITRRRHQKLAHKGLPAYGKIPFNLLASKTLATAYIDDDTINEVVSFLQNRIDYIADHISFQLNFKITQQSIR